MDQKTLPPNAMLPMHLMMQWMQLHSSQAALHGLKRASASSKGRKSPSANLPPELSALFRQISGEPRIEKLIDWEINQQQATLFESIRSFSRARYRRDMPEPPVTWKAGSTRLLNYTLPKTGRGARAKKPVFLLIPSLINRYYILDLNEKLSFARFLAKQGHPTFLVDWGMPGAEEKQFDAGDYVTHYLTAITEQVKSAYPNAPLILVGHCMGGMLAMALAAHLHDKIDGMALLSTPWDFHPLQLPIHRRMQPQHISMLEEYIAALEVFPGDHLLMLFYLRDPSVFQEKLAHFRELAEDSPEREQFLSLEYWVNDVAPITTRVAQNCFVDWVIHNTPLENRWQVGGRTVRPDKIRTPTFLVIPERDKIVPPEASYPLEKTLPFVTSVIPDSGHVGMLVSRRAEAMVWQPLLEWAAEAV